MPYAEQTVQFGYLVAHLYGASVTLLTVVAKKSERAGAEGMLAGLVARHEAAVENQVVRRGKTAVSEIVSECQQGNYDLVVLGTRLVPGLSLFKRSSVARTVTKKVPIPVLVVKQAPQSLRRFLICTSGLEEDPAVINFGLELASKAGAAVHLLYVADPLPQMYSGLETMEETVEELLESGTPIAENLQRAVKLLSEAAIETRLIKRHGLVVDEILKEIEETDYDLVVVGASEREAFWQSLILGNVSPYIVENASCSVLVVHHL